MRRVARRRRPRRGAVFCLCGNTSQSSSIGTAPNPDRGTLAPVRCGAVTLRLRFGTPGRGRTRSCRPPEWTPPPILGPAAHCHNPVTVETHALNPPLLESRATCCDRREKYGGPLDDPAQIPEHIHLRRAS